MPFRSLPEKLTLEVSSISNLSFVIAKVCIFRLQLREGQTLWLQR